MINTPIVIASIQQMFGYNIILLILGFCSLLGLTIFLERIFYLRRAETDTNSLVISLRQSIREGNMIQAIQTCENTGGTLCAILKAGLTKHYRARSDIESAMEMSGLSEIAKLEKNAKTLSILAHLCPLIGLLGTVLGFIQAFSEMRETGLVDISATRIGEAMEYALLTTAAGLAVAIPCVIGYNYLVSRVEAFILDIQITCAEIVDLLIHKEEDHY